jgi:type II secretory pathway pseudopilin PulG
MQCPQCSVTLPTDARFCSGCGQAIPGARGPAAALASSGWTTPVIVAAALVSLVMIGGIVAAIAIPNLLNAIDRGKQKRSVADLRAVGTAIEAYRVDHDAYPVAHDFGELRETLTPQYLRMLPMMDGWGHAYHVSSSGTTYEIRSLGKDGVQQGCDGGESGRFADDICFRDGKFTQWPAGVQR